MWQILLYLYSLKVCTSGNPIHLIPLFHKFFFYFSFINSSAGLNALICVAIFQSSFYYSSAGYTLLSLQLKFDDDKMRTLYFFPVVKSFPVCLFFLLGSAYLLFVLCFLVLLFSSVELFFCCSAYSNYGLTTAICNKRNNFSSRFAPKYYLSSFFLRFPYYSGEFDITVNAVK